MKILTWENLTKEEQKQTTETYLYIREIEEDRLRNEVTEDYPEPIDKDGVKDCKFERDEYGYIVVII